MSWNPVSVHKNYQKYRWQIPIWASICTPVASSLLISSGCSPRLGGHNFRLGGHKQSFGGAQPQNALRGAGPESNSNARVKTPNVDFTNKYIINLGIKGGGYLMLVNYQSLLLNIFSSAHQIIFRFKIYTK